MNKKYEPYGKDWVKMLMKHKKEDLIEFYKTACLENRRLKESIKPKGE